MRCQYLCDCESVAYADDVLHTADLSVIGTWVTQEWRSACLNVVEAAPQAHPLYGPAHGTCCVIVGAFENLATGRTLGNVPLSELLSVHGSAFETVLGTPGSDWGAIQVRGYAYGCDAGLDWHRDGSVFAGTAVIYVHENWHAGWGGILTVVPPCGREFELEPIPNRMIIMRGDQKHKVSSWRGPQNSARLTANLSFLTRIGCFAANHPWTPRE